MRGHSTELLLVRRAVASEFGLLDLVQRLTTQSRQRTIAHVTWLLNSSADTAYESRASKRVGRGWWIVAKWQAPVLRRCSYPIHYSTPQTLRLGYWAEAFRNRRKSEVDECL